MFVFGGRGGFFFCAKLIFPLSSILMFVSLCSDLLFFLIFLNFKYVLFFILRFCHFFLHRQLIVLLCSFFLFFSFPQLSLKIQLGQTWSWPNLVLAKLGLGQTWSWPNLVLAKLGLGQTWSWPNLVVLAKLGLGQIWSWPNLVWPNLAHNFGQTWIWPNLVSPLATSSSAAANRFRARSTKAWHESNWTPMALSPTSRSETGEWQYRRLGSCFRHDRWAEGVHGLLGRANDDHDLDALHFVVVVLAARRLTDCVADAIALTEGGDLAELAATSPLTTLRRTPISHAASLHVVVKNETAKESQKELTLRQTSWRRFHTNTAYARL